MSRSRVEVEDCPSNHSGAWCRQSSRSSGGVVVTGLIVVDQLQGGGVLVVIYIALGQLCVLLSTSK
uniref:Uncharacterized protein n=1 Tax=Oryza sativa subsp. japonica TaxID=39947 RepID=Q5Z5G5_ORYSJ|nr:hypothetical protein [Oryza sativa Japonica Group]BAD54604.1 hypothetical protein [Oryza sativa Japonica Group]